MPLGAPEQQREVVSPWICGLDSMPLWLAFFWGGIPTV